MDKSKFNNKKEWRKFAIGLGVISWLIGTFQLIFGRDLYPYFYAAGLIIFLVGLTFPVIIKPIFILFSYLGFGMGWFMTRLILAVLFYFIFLPIGFFLKLFSRDSLSLKIDKKTNSYWLESKLTNFEKDDFERQF